MTVCSSLHFVICLPNCSIIFYVWRFQCILYWGFGITLNNVILTMAIMVHVLTVLFGHISLDKGFSFRPHKRPWIPLYTV
jgi:hypothetical protein